MAQHKRLSDKDTNWRITHGLSNSPEYQVWRGAISRCHCKTAHKYPIYGGKGIFVCEEWRHSFENFYRDMGPRPSPKYSLDRIDGNGPYCAENCRWATITEQNNNKRVNRHISFGGRTMTVSQWAEELGVNRQLIFRRLDSGLPAEEILTAERRLKPKLITWNGQTKNVAEWARVVGLKRETLRERLKAGWTVERALGS